ncbi:unnamed protein product [Lepeophtheirus salmonis]|uniref:(salmon louse) hypothetical protein n=1 Tax=Lepeophtheirus salmonis TaxID=72036 RepID=A0A7R8H5P5_LEPSM|nr:unnamed protein product [Lepeophtheirus salmonis]CAF2871308.1 unnamed protein product [Lepeophtheirus salmonis]
MSSVDPKQMREYLDFISGRLYTLKSSVKEAKDPFDVIMVPLLELKHPSELNSPLPPVGIWLRNLICVLDVWINIVLKQKTSNTDKNYKNKQSGPSTLVNLQFDSHSFNDTMPHVPQVMHSTLLDLIDFIRPTYTCTGWFDSMSQQSRISKRVINKMLLHGRKPFEITVCGFGNRKLTLKTSIASFGLSSRGSPNVYSTNTLVSDDRICSDLKPLFIDFGKCSHLKKLDFAIQEDHSYLGLTFSLVYYLLFVTGKIIKHPDSIVLSAALETVFGYVLLGPNSYQIPSKFKPKVLVTNISKKNKDEDELNNLVEKFWTPLLKEEYAKAIRSYEELVFSRKATHEELQEFCNSFQYFISDHPVTREGKQLRKFVLFSILVFRIVSEFDYRINNIVGGTTILMWTTSFHYEIRHVWCEVFAISRNIYGGWNLTKFVSNSSELLDFVSTEDRLIKSFVELKDTSLDGTTMALGIGWYGFNDCFQYQQKSNFPDPLRKYTKKDHSHKNYRTIILELEKSFGMKNSMSLESPSSELRKRSYTPFVMQTSLCTGAWFMFDMRMTVSPEKKKSSSVKLV